MPIKKIRSPVFVCVALCCLVGGSIGAAANEDPDANLSFDGLVPVKNGAFERVWLDPEVDFAVYDKIILGDARFEFREVKDVRRSTNYSSKTEFPISDKNRQKLVEEVTKVFDEELRKSKSFTIVTDPGPDVLILEGAMLDIVSRVPPQRAGRDNIFLSRVGEATLVLQLRDSLTGRTLVRAAERRAAQTGGNRATLSNPVTTWQEVRRLARRWGSKLRKGLDSVHKD
jgi:hypothetical protein